MIKKLFILTGFLFFTITVAQSTTHTVSQGDTAYSISKKYGLTLNQLFQLNPSVVEGKIAIGDVLKVKSDAKNAPIEAASNGTLGTIIVQPKQTVYGITKKFKISESDLKKWNPLLESEGLKIGSQLSLPKDKIKKFADPQEMILPINTEAKVVNTTIHPTDEFVSYTVENGDTIFSLVSKFGTTIDELTTWNPTLSQGLKSGMSLKVKKMEAAYKKKNNDALNVVLMLPFGYNSNDTKYRSVSMDFLTGAKLAIERNVKAGMKLEVIVVDAGNEQSFKSSLSQINVNNTDLIIGPFFKSSVLDALDYVGDKKIPLVSPFANSEDLYGYSNLIITEANEDIYVDKMNDEIGKIYSNQKIYLLSGNTPEMAQKLKAKLEQKINKSLISIVKSANDIQADKNMMTGKAAPIIAVLADDNEALANDFANRLIQLSKEVNGVKGFSMTFSTIFEKKYNDLSQVNFVYLMDRKINTDGEFEKEILKDYKNKYCTTPSKYSIIGFDVVNDMLSRENKNGEIYNQMGKTQTQLATKFEFVKTKSNGAYINQGVRIIRFTP